MKQAGTAAQVHLQLGETLVAAVALAAPGGLEAVRVAAFSADEGGSGSRADAWSHSHHCVFQCAINTPSLNAADMPNSMLVHPAHCLLGVSSMVRGEKLVRGSAGGSISSCFRLSKGASLKVGCCASTGAYQPGPCWPWVTFSSRRRQQWLRPPASTCPPETGRR